MNNTTTYPLEAFDLVQLLFNKYHDHQIHGVIELDTHINGNTLFDAVKESSKDLPQIFCSLKNNKWIPLEVQFSDIIKIIRCNLTDYDIESALSHAVDTKNGPQLSITILRGPKNDVLCIVMNHMLCDGAGFKSYLYLLSSLYNHIVFSERTNIIYSPYKRDLSCLMNSVKNLKTEKTKNEKINTHLIAHDFEGNDANPRIMTTCIEENDFINIKNYAKSSGATLNDMFLAAYFITLHKLWHSNINTIACAVDLRKYLLNKLAPGLCNLTSNLVCTIKSYNDSFKDILKQVSESMNIQKNSTSCLNDIFLLDRIYRYMPYPVSKKIISKALTNPPIALSNIGLIDDTKLIFNGITIKSCYITGAIKHAPNFQVAVSTFKNKVTLSTNMFASKKDEKEIREFLKSFKNELLTK